MRVFLACLACITAVMCALPARTRACGGTFCDSASASAPVPMTVDQSGENILFVQLDGKIEAHVQIRYQGDPKQLAWLVPMPAIPEIAVGSQPLFDALLADSAPRYGIRTTVMHCDGTTDTSESTGCGGGGTKSPSYGGTASDTDQDSADMMDPIGETVGSFDVTILQPKLGDDVPKWIRDNDFQLPAQTQALIDPYVQAGSVFVAMRLTPGAGVREIHPIVFRYPGTHPSIPIQLTAVAATVDMRVRTFFLGDGRTVPSNYRHVQLDPVRLNWLGFAGNYESVVSAAVDDTGDGLGFVTEYAGSSSVVDESSVYDERWDADAFIGLDPFAALDELTRQGQISCQAGGACSFPHPLVLPLLERYLPAPAGTNENVFYSCLRCAEDQVDRGAWDSEAFARDYRERVIDPALHARELLETRPYLTRMITFISPEEMIADPAFHVRADLPAVEREHWATSTISCEGDQHFELPDGREVVITGLGFSWPGSDSSVPSAERIELIPETGDPIVELDASAEIDASLDVINKRNRRQIDGISNLSAGRSGGACSVSSGFAQQSAWIGAALLYLGVRRRRRSPQV